MIKPVKYLVVIAGPTGIGKTDLSIRLARLFKTDIISCDSRQMYREMKIGTAAPSPGQLQMAPHHFIANLSIHDYYNAFNFETEALDLMNILYSNIDVVILTGGSGLYLDAVLYGMDDIPDPDRKIRQELTLRIEQEGLENLAAELREIDPEYYNEADIHNPKRILRGLEVWYSTGKRFSSFRIRKDKPRPFVPVIINLVMDRRLLYSRIDSRVDLMLKEGLKEEARSLYPYRHLNSLNTVGYKEWFSHFDGLFPEEEAVRLIKRNSRHYAKRQLTWNKKYEGAFDFHPDQWQEILNRIKDQTGLSG